MAYLGEKLGDRNLQLSFTTQDGQRKLLEICLTYLSFNKFAKGPSPAYNAFVTRLEAFPFIAYAVRNWYTHAQLKLGRIEANIKALIMSFLRNPEKISSAEQVRRLDGRDDAYRRAVNGVMN